MSTAGAQEFIGQIINGSMTENIIIASIAAGVYFLFMLLTISNIIRDKRAVHLYLILFCAVRVAAFSIRAYMQKHLDQNLAIVYEVFFAVGFVFLVKLLLSLLAHWSALPGPQNAPTWSRGKFSLGVMSNHGTLLEKLITVALAVGIILAIVGGTQAYDSNATVQKFKSGLDLIKAAYTIYLVCILAYICMVVSGPLRERVKYGRPNNMRSATFVALALFACGLLLTIRCVFQVVAIYANPKLQFENQFFYPLEVIPELGVLAIICVPGFIDHVLQGSHAHPEVDQSKLQPAGTVEV